MRALFIAAHPDDIEFGCAGTIIHLKERGDEIHWILMSNGENDENRTMEQRRNELEEALNFLKISTVHFMNLKDGFIEDNAEVISALKKVMDEIEPDVVLTHYLDDRHQDHRKTSLCVRSACWGKYNLLYFASYSTMNFTPSIFVNISDEIDDKRKSIELYRSQISKYKSRGIDFVECSIANDKQNGGNIHSLFAEGFQAANCVWK